MDVERLGHGAGNAQMLAHLLGGAVQIHLRRPGELELATRLERDAAGDLVVPEPDRVVPVIKRVPARCLLDAGEQRTNPLLAFIGHWPQRIGVEDVLFVFGADPPLVRGFSAPR